MGETDIEAENATTIPDFLNKTCDEMPDVKALFWKDSEGKPWQDMTYADYKILVYNVAKSFLKVYYIVHVSHCIQ